MSRLIRLARLQNPFKQRLDSKAAGWGVMIKTGAPSWSERLAKYNRVFLSFLSL
ncbi:hypothetical protein IFM89_027125 [Coptis chinensis]|uniref:Uncharacterized protein n=1 Tax=Coptis chinensis TaxID=261450 RepID=A0A835MAS2_9MAGN|nr:hypothetical protein IFM89_027125 [Coptis chinensis]